MLRHSTGFYLANKGTDTRAIQAYMGRSNINNTVIYTAMDANRFNNFWKRQEMFSIAQARLPDGTFPR